MPQYGTVTANILNMRSNAGTFAEIVAKLKQGAVVEVLEIVNPEWVKIKTQQGQEGCVAVEYLALTETKPETPDPDDGFEEFNVKVTTQRLRTRSGPGTDFNILGVLNTGDVVTVKEVLGDWYRVNLFEDQGHIHKNFTERTSAEAVPLQLGYLIEQPSLLNAGLKPKRLIPIDGLEPRKRRWVAANIWNTYGGLIEKLAQYLDVPIASMVAVIGAESAGKAFGEDGRVIVRFEVHLFHRFWGKLNQAIFDRHFQFEGWKNHQFRLSQNEAWRAVHVDQAREHEVLAFARGLDDSTALSSISIGAPQIMGFNYKRLGYESVQQMYEAFARSVHAQILGLFDFVKGPGKTSDAIRALQNGDFLTFASFYNGTGNAPTYEAIISDYVGKFNQLLPTAVEVDESFVLDEPEEEAADSPSVSDTVDVAAPEEADQEKAVTKNISVPPVEKPTATVRAVPTDRLNFRDAPEGNKIQGVILEKGVPVKILEPIEQALQKMSQPEAANQWLHVENNDGVQGYAAAWFMTPLRTMSAADVDAYIAKLPEASPPSGYEALWSQHKKLGLPNPFDVLPVQINTEHELVNMQVNGFGPNTFAFWFWEKWYSRIGGMHNGYDFIVKTGTPLLAVSDGVIIKNWIFMANPKEVTTVLWCFLPEEFRDSKGNRMMSNVLVAYGHMASNTEREKFEVVKAGDVIGLSGTPAGSNTNDHLHYEVHLLQGDNNLPNPRPKRRLLSAYKRDQPLDNNTPWNPLLFYSKRLINYQVHQGDSVGYMNKHPDYPTVAMMKNQGVHHLPELDQLSLAYYRYGIPVVWNKPASGIWSEGVITTDMLEGRLQTYEAFEPYEADFLG